MTAICFQPTEQRQVIVNGQQTQTPTLLQAVRGAAPANNLNPTQQDAAQAATDPNVKIQDQNKQFIVTPDYIQQSMFVYRQPSVIVYNPNYISSYPMQNDLCNQR